MTTVKDFTEQFSNSPAFTYRDTKLFLTEKGKNSENLARLLTYMKTSGKIYAIKKGVYTFDRDDAASGFAFSPFYYGLLYALTIRDLWTQIARPEIITPRKFRASTNQIFGDPQDVVFVHHIPARYFFGYDLIKSGKFTLPVSTPEKTLIDLFYYKVKLPIQDYGELLKVVKMQKLLDLLKMYDSRINLIVLSFTKKYKSIADSGKLTSPY